MTQRLRTACSVFENNSQNPESQTRGLAVNEGVNCYVMQAVRMDVGISKEKQ